MGSSDKGLDSPLQKLPRRRRWTLAGTPLDWSFPSKGKALRPLDKAVFDFSPRPAWLTLLMFGEYDYAEGGGAKPFIGIKPTTGAVYGLDVERDRRPMFLLNSSVEAFVDTFNELDVYLAKGRPLPADIDRRLRGIDVAAYGRSDWKAMVGFVRQVLDE